MATLSPPCRNPRKWNYTWEALTHIPTLRLFLFSPGVDPSTCCKGLCAALQPEKHVLVVRWVEEEGGAGEVVVCIPVPRILIDSGSPVEFAAREDHVEVKLVLVLPVDHPIIVGFREGLRLGGMEDDGPLDWSMPLVLDSDLKVLSGGDVHFYCNTCSTRLTRNCIRNFVELPSVNWREVADNWFGTCCCSFGGISEKLVSKYINLYSSVAGTCLLDPTSVIICKDDLETSVSEDNKRDDGADNKSHLIGSDERKDIANNSCNSLLSESVTDNENSPTVLHRQEAELISINRTKALEIQNDISSMFCAPYPIAKSDGNEGLTAHTHEINIINVSHLNGNANVLQHVSDVGSKLGSSLCCGNHEKPFSDQSECEFTSLEFHHCHISQADNSFSSQNRIYQQSTEKSMQQRSQNLPHNGSLGGGFMVRPSNLSNEIKWVAFLCRNCLAPLGSYPSSFDVDTPVDEGIRLFKCCIATSRPAGGCHDIFRKHSLPKVFMNLLLESADDELSFRTIVSDLDTKSPLLKVVLVSSKVWCCSGDSFETDMVEPVPHIDLKPFAKVLYSDCISATSDNLRMLEEWSSQNHADEVYMMAHQIQELIEGLKTSQKRLPSSCSSLQGMSLSLIERYWGGYNAIEVQIRT